MSHTWSLCAAARAAGVVVLLLPFGLTGCSERARGAEADRAASTQASPGDPDGDTGATRPPIDPCAIITAQEISEQLLHTVAPSQRANWTSTEFDVVPTEVDWGVARRCEITYRSRQEVSGGPAERGAFNLMVFRSDGLGIPERERRPVAGAGPEIFKHQQVFYLTKGDYAVSLTDFKGTQDTPGNENEGRIALLRTAASRLP
jgi:hypothetical protein